MSVQLPRVLALAAVATIAHVSPASACEPAPNCGTTYCYTGARTLVAGRIVARQSTAFPPTVTVEIASVHGDAGSLVAGSTVELAVAYEWQFEASDVNRSFQLLLRPVGGGAPEVVERIDLADPFATGCFGADAPAATVADVVLSPSCFDTLEPNYEDPCAGSCSAAGAASSSLWPLAALGLVVLGAGRGRRRRGARPAR